MALPALVLVHGGAHAADCWDLTVDELHRQAPELSVLAVDLPGRAGKPGELAALSIGDCVESVVADIGDAGLRDVVICGHSMAGVIVPSVVTKLGSPRAREMILAGAFVPPQGTSVLDTLGGPLVGMPDARPRPGRPRSKCPRGRTIGVLQWHDTPTTTVPAAANLRGVSPLGDREGRSRPTAR
jgi:pimeloyl-ACP methyl ester carboxylesterase